MSTNPNAAVAVWEQTFNRMILEGKGMEAFEKFYADDVVMQENNDEPTKGKDANRQREEEFFGMVDELNALELHSWAAEGNVSFGEWTYDVTFQDGNRVKWSQVHRRVWSDDGKVVHERFYHEGF